LLSELFLSYFAYQRNSIVCQFFSLDFVLVDFSQFFCQTSSLLNKLCDGDDRRQ